jgi:hypothetical protein
MSLDSDSGKDLSNVRVKHHHRFELESPLMDMKCGVNGEPFQQEFHPTYFTADWTDGLLVQVRIWGPRILDDGSFGERLLDHRWKTSLANAPLVLSGIPPVVARQLRAYEESGAHLTASMG